jgi:hypothetical protein
MKTFEELWSLPWPEIVVVTGSYGTGKSTFTLGTGAPPERTMVVDFEKSQRSFAQQLPIKYVDMQAILSEKYPNGYKLLNLFDETVRELDAVENGKFDVIVLDNASMLEEGILAYVEKNPQEFGHSAGQYTSMSGLKWGDVKTKYAQLLTRWASKVKMIFIVVHLRDKWVGNSVVKDPFGKPVQEPKGKETLDMLSSLFVWLEHGPGGIPAARVLKCRMDRKVFISDPSNPPIDIPSRYLAELNTEPGLVSLPILPLRLPKCTWPMIREYMRNPADLANPKPGEMPTDAQMSEDDRLKLRSIISMNEAEKAAVDKIRLEQGEPHTQSNLLRFARETFRMEPAEVGEALKRRNLAPFNPDRWETMKEAIREFSENKNQPAEQPIHAPVQTATGTGAPATAQTNAEIITPETVQTSAGYADPVTGELVTSQMTAPLPAQPPAGEKPVETMNGTNRPYAPVVVKMKLDRMAADRYASVTVNDAQRNLLRYCLELCFTDLDVTEKRRHTVTHFLTGHESTNDVPAPMVKAMLDIWLKPEKVKDGSGDYTINPFAVQEARAIYAEAIIREGQLTMPLMTERDPKVEAEIPAIFR